MNTETNLNLDWRILNCKNFPPTKPQIQIKVYFGFTLRMTRRKILTPLSYLYTAISNNIIFNVCGYVSEKLEILCSPLGGLAEAIYKV